MKSFRIVIEGTVQGVGFRPFIYGLAKRYNLKGTVSNSSSGVEIFINSLKEVLNSFLLDIEENHPPLSKIESIKIDEVKYREFKDFQIIETRRDGDIFANIPPDISICSKCEKELFDPKNRRYLYPFITCTNCGVRYSIIYDLPYDRANTSMKIFKMCKACEAEYKNPLDRRYHAEPIGCWDCGANLTLLNRDKELNIDRGEVIKKSIELLKEGNILAIKGVGGYHLICDATNQEAIKKLRDRKRRPTKPFAVMVQNIKMAKELAFIDKIEEELLTSKERPIVLLKSKIKDEFIAPNISKIGLFLPYTPLHLLILNELKRPIIATSANITDEPIATNREEIKRVSSIYDYLLDHNREIVNGCDDSVVMVVKGQIIFIRRARGYTPISITLPFRLDKKVLSVGANQKNTVAIGFENRVILSPHIGDLKGIESIEYFRENIKNLERIYRFKPEVVICDRHPNYESTKYAKSLNIEKKEIQHHYAHILAVMVEKNITKKVLGVAFDGTGYGADGNLWGGEFLICDYKNYNRVAHFKYFKLLGGEKAIREPRRVALSLLFDIFGEETLNLDNPTIRAFRETELKTQYLIWKKGLNSPLTSSAGRLFDAVSSLSGVCQIMSFEGESGMRMEEFYNIDIRDYYPFIIEKSGEINIYPMVQEILKEKSREVIISKFFNTLVEIIFTIYKRYNLPIILSGGVFQNRVLLELILEKIPNVIVPNKVPPNDGSIALGQVASIL